MDITAMLVFGRLRFRGVRAPVVDCAYGCEKENQEEKAEIKQSRWQESDYNQEAV